MMNAIKMGMSVHGSDGAAGRVDDVLAHKETGQPAYLVVSTAGLFGNDVVLPFEQVRSVDDAGVWLELTRDEVKHATPYSPDGYGAAAGLISQAAGRYGED